MSVQTMTLHSPAPILQAGSQARKMLRLLEADAADVQDQYHNELDMWTNVVGSNTASMSASLSNPLTPVEGALGFGQ